MLSIIGGSYIENCIDPTYHEHYGSGLRAAAALSSKGFEIGFHSCICKKYEPLAILKSHTFGYTTQYHSIPKTIEFDYYHPLSTPTPIIEQDLVNLGLGASDLGDANNLTEDKVCIAEAFVQFAQKYEFDFWRLN